MIRDFLEFLAVLAMVLLYSFAFILVAKFIGKMLS